jgi:hypothetical protein
VSAGLAGKPVGIPEDIVRAFYGQCQTFFTLAHCLFRPLLFRNIPSDSGDANRLAVRILEQGAGPVIGNGTKVFGEQLAVKFGIPFREGSLNSGGGAGLFFWRDEGQGRLVQ